LEEFEGLGIGDWIESNGHKYPIEHLVGGGSRQERAIRVNIGYLSPTGDCYLTLDRGDYVRQGWRKLKQENF
jgi:hypothetical protein